MIKISIKGRELEVEQDELVLLVTSGNFDKDRKKSANLGMFCNSRKDPKGLDCIMMRGVYILRECEKFGGIDIPIVAESRSIMFYTSRNIQEIYFGQEEIVKKLQTWPRFEAHAEWVSRLNKPY